MKSKTGNLACESKLLVFESNLSVAGSKSFYLDQK